MKPKPGDFLGEGPGAKVEKTDVMDSGTDIPMPKLRTDGYYVQFPDESLEEAVDAHSGDPFDSVQECFEFVTEAGMDVGQTFNVVNIDGRIFKKGIVTHDGAEELDTERLRR